jgi:hypothetical protein
MVIPAGCDGQFRMRCWADAARATAPYEVSFGEAPALRAMAVSLLREGAYGCIELAVWNIELNDWVRMETLSAPAAPPWVPSTTRPT